MGGSSDEDDPGYTEAMTDVARAAARRTHFPQALRRIDARERLPLHRVVRGEGRVRPDLA